MFEAVVAVAKALVALGRERDYVTYGEVHATLAAAQVSPEMVEDLVTMLHDVGIGVVPDGEDDGPGGWRASADRPRNPGCPFHAVEEARWAAAVAA